MTSTLQSGAAAGFAAFLALAPQASAAEISPSVPSPARAPTFPRDSAPLAPVRSRAEIEALIAKAGATPPEWWNSAPLRYPPTLDLTWADPGKQWNAQKNLGQYIWDIVNPNPPRWREGVRLLHHVLTVNKDHPEKVARTAEALGRMYQHLLQDWARAAFWWRKVIQLGGYSEADFAFELGQCYWRLGNRDMCVELISKLDEDDSRNGSLIKLWADLGMIETALKLAEEKALSDAPDPAYLAAAEACRLAGRTSAALTYYRHVTALKNGSHDLKRNQERAAASIEAIQVFDHLELKRIPDGLYHSSSIAYNGPLHVAVAVKSARLESVKVTQHTEKQFYSAITDTTSRIIAKQGVKGVDMTSGATITAEAIVNATAKALAAAMK